MRSLIPWKRQDRNLAVQREEDDPFFGLWQDVNRVFGDFFTGTELTPFSAMRGGFTPSINITESEKEIAVTAELPGLDEKDVELSLSQGALTIRGEKKQENEEKGRDFYRMERSYGTFSRTIPLPRDVVDADKVTAEFEKGVLRVTLPKLETAQTVSRRIPVNRG